MKAYLIKASAQGEYKKYKQKMGGPPQNIFAVAAATPSHIKLDMCDETADMKINYRSDCDVVAIFMSTPDAIHAYQVAKKFKQKGKVVVFGGLHATALPEEALQHGDSVIIGEAEGIWEQLLVDIAENQLKPRYKREEMLDLKELKPYPTKIIPLSQYGEVWSVTVSRGCPYTCGFCTVPNFFSKQRYRPLEDVINEIKNSGAQWIELHADNLLVNRQYAEDLFKALIPLKINWIGETSINLARDEELLALAAKSGLRHVLLGLETPSEAALKESGKGFVKTDKVKEKIALFNKYQIEVDSSFIFGFDETDKNIFKQTYDYCQEIGIQSIHSVILIPFPGSPTYSKLESEGRLITKDWSLYDGTHAVFKPKNMTADELEQGADWFHLQISKLENKTLKPPPPTPNNKKVGKEPKGKTEALEEKQQILEEIAASSEISIPETSTLQWLLDSLRQSKWKSVLALSLAAVAAIKGWMFFWGILCLFWAVVNIRSSEAYFVERIQRRENPILYWIIISVWLVLSAIYFASEPLIFETIAGWLDRLSIS